MFRRLITAQLNQIIMGLKLIAITKDEMRFRKIRQTALSVSDRCMSTAALLALAPMILFDKMGIRGGDSRMRLAMIVWALSFLVMLPVTGPLMLIGILIDRVFVVQPIRDELMTKRQDAPLQKLNAVQ